MGGESKPTEHTDYPQLVDRPVGQQIRSIYKDRLRQFTAGGQYSSQNLLGKLYEGRADGEDCVKLEVWDVPDLQRPSFKEAMKKAEWRKTKKGDSFGPSWSTHWFRITVKLPKELRDKEHIEFHWDAGNEGLIYSHDGVPVHGLTGGGDRVEYILPKKWKDGKQHMFYIEMACNKMFGNADGDSIQPPNPNHYFRLNKADLVAVNLDARGLYIDFWIIGDAAREFPQDGWESHKALQICLRIMDTFIAGEGSKDTIKKCREIAREYTGNIDTPDIYDGDNEDLVFAVGHCHIDTCWLWPWAETKRKVARSWSNQCDLIDRYPELTFVCSQAQQYQWLEKYYPEIFDRVKAKVKEGSFQPIGGSWVEHDTNLPSGESLVRQFIYGQRLFESRFGDRCKTFWLPDTFGYSAQLPQLCRLAGMTRFFTQKLSWNNVNRFPHTTFNWVALDGSQVLSHMAPSNTYTADAHFGDVKRSMTQHKSLDQDNTSLLVFGKGDGGGGPTWEMMEKLRRCRGISDTTGLLPRVKLGNSVDDFFAKLEKKAANGVDFTTWYGELYFEFHRGTYTSQADNKWYNRKTEVMMHDVEFLATMASFADNKYKYPKEDIDFCWESILLCQFHDCLPGSSIEMCYRDSDKLYAKVVETGHKMMEEALASIGLSFKKTEGVNSNKTLALNTLPWSRNELLSDKESGEGPVPVSGQLGLLYGDEELLGDNEEPSPRKPGSGTMLFKREKAEVRKEGSNAYILENHSLRVRIHNGAITSLYDKISEREVVAEGKTANQLVVFDDKPLYWQAWDVEVYHLDSRKELSAHTTEIGEEGPHRVSVITKTKVSDKSWVKTEISLSASPGHMDSMVEMHSEVEWHETMKFLKVEFAVDVMNTEASYETQFGVIRRPTHYNTSWDMAKFEVCCHKFADLSEHDYGVAILNDSKYGFATAGNVMRLSLLRAPKAPDAHADMGRHHIRYAMYPHRRSLNANVVRRAREFNHPLRAVHPLPAPSGSTATAHSQRTLNFARAALSALSFAGSDSIVLDTVKRGEDDADVSRGDLPARKRSSGRSVVLRFYEALGGKSRGVIRWDEGVIGKVERVCKVNVLEDEIEEVEISSFSARGEGKGKVRCAQIELRAFEVATFRLEIKEGSWVGKME